MEIPNTIRTTPIAPIHATPQPGPVNANELADAVAGDVDD
jgi:hypothetical protein